MLDSVESEFEVQFSAAIFRGLVKTVTLGTLQIEWGAEG